jgi:hypothetical protein
MTAVLSWRRAVAVVFTLATLATVLYTLGAPNYQGG